MAKKIDVEILLKSVILNDDLKFKKSTGHLLEVKLVYPRPTVASKTTTKALTLENSKWQCDGRTWTEAILFKETISGMAGVEIAVSEALSDSELSSFLRSAGASFIKYIGDIASDTIGLKSLAPLAEIPVDAVAKSLSQGADSIAIGSGIADINGEVVAGLKDKVIEFDIPIIATRDFVENKSKHGKTPAAGTKRRVLAKKGEQVGTVSLQVKMM